MWSVAMTLISVAATRPTSHRRDLILPLIQ